MKFKKLMILGCALTMSMILMVGCNTENKTASKEKVLVYGSGGCKIYSRNNYGS